MGDFQLAPPRLMTDAPRAPRLLDEDLQLSPERRPGTPPPAPILPPPSARLLPPPQLEGVFDHYADGPTPAPPAAGPVRTPAPTAAVTPPAPPAPTTRPADAPLRVTGRGDAARGPSGPTGSVTGGVVLEGRDARIAAEAGVNNEGTLTAGGTATVGDGDTNGSVSAGVRRSNSGATAVTGEMRARTPGLDVRARGRLNTGDEPSGSIDGSVTLGSADGLRVILGGGVNGLGTADPTGTAEAGVRARIAPGIDAAAGLTASDIRPGAPPTITPTLGVTGTF